MGPAAHTLLLVLQSGPSGSMISSSLQPECVEGLLSYARLFFAQPHSGKFSILAAAGRKIHTVTNWDPGEQSVEAIVQGLADWRAFEGDGGLSVKQTLMEVTQFLYETTGKFFAEVNAANKPTPDWEISSLLRGRLVVILPQDSGVGGGISTYHKYMEEALSGMSLPEIEIETTFLDITTSNAVAEPIMTTAAASVPFHLTTTHYKLLPSQASDLFLDLAYCHLELSAIAVKGILPHLLEMSGDNAEKVALMGRDSKAENSAALDTVLRLVICQGNMLNVKSASEVSVYPGSPLFRDLRTTSLNYVKTTLSTSQLLALPCASIAPTLPETFQRGPTAQLWEYLKRHDNDSLMVALSIEKDTGNITHLFIWRDGRFWLQAISRTDQSSSSPTTLADCKGDDLPGNNEAGVMYQKGLHATSEVLLTTPPRRAGHPEKVSNYIAKKRKPEEAEESGPQSSPNLVSLRHRRSAPHSSKQLERPSRWISGFSLESTVGSAERYSLHLASLISPIRIAFEVEDPPVDHLSDASKCIEMLSHHAASNDISLFPHTVDMPSARKELYKKVWIELDGMVKQRVKKTSGQEELAHAIAIAGADCGMVEEKASVPTAHPVLSEKPTDFPPVNKRRRCEEVPRDLQGRPVFPIKLGPSLQVYDLGKIIWNRPSFHSEKYIWPSGYKSRRAYASMLNSENRIFYWCEIFDDGQAPEFRLTPEDDQSNPVVGISATAVWTVVVKRVGALRIEEGGKKTFANVSGPEYFGYANPTIARLIQQLPDAEKCTKYRRQEYLPNVPMRTVDTEVAQGTLVPEGSVSPLRRTPNPTEEDLHTPTPTLLSASVREDSGAAAESIHDVGSPMELEEPVEAAAACKEEEEEKEKPLSWLMEFRIRKKAKDVGKFPKEFAGCNPGSLFSHYWSAKLRRMRTIELDGRR